MNDEIDTETYKKWRETFNREKAIIEQEIEGATNGTGNLSGKWHKLNTFLQSLRSVKDLYRIATFELKIILIRMVFKQFLTYSEGTFRTLSFNLGLLKIKEKGCFLLSSPIKFGIISRTVARSGLEPETSGL